jgi:signal transduction histidine kinase/CheY-like chemotaxis protein/HPt (histidine-containing phosphotransfer) domain-containing protein
MTTFNPMFEVFLSDQGYALFESLGGGAFRPVGNCPAWCRKIWPGAGQKAIRIALGEESPFLGNFLVDAQGLWHSKRKEALVSGVWVERDSAGRETPLEAWAVRLDGKPVLVVRNLSVTYAERQQLYQKARDSLLEHERLIREVQKKEILLHTIVHDLSQPLNAMRGCFNILSLEELPEDLRHMVETGQRESHRQEEMIRGILEAFSSDLAAQQAAQQTPAEAPHIGACAKQVVENLAPAFIEKGIRLQLDPALDLSHNWKVVGDASRIERIFGNLLENALRYSPKGTSVTIGLEEKGSFVLAYVDDQGPGLPKDATPDRLFALFAKGKDKPGKAGLGLYFCKITIERWGGSIGAETRSGGGSRFWFRLPHPARTSAARVAKKRGAEKRSVSAPEKRASAEKPREPVPAEAPAASGPGRIRIGKSSRPLRVLVAEDTEVNRELVQELLQKRGHSVVCVEDGSAAVAAWEQQPFDVVLMDEQMPGVNGLEATRQIRRKESATGKHQIIVGVTGNVSEEDKQRRAEAGMDGTLTKPFDMFKLFQAVESHLGGGDRAQLGAPAKAVPAAVETTAPAEDVATHLARTTGENKKLIQSLVRSFLGDAPKKISDIRRAVAKKDAAALGSSAHALKGAIAIFGAPQAVAAARNLESMGRSGKIAGAEKEFLALEKEIALLERELLGISSASKKTSAASRPHHKR